MIMLLSSSELGKALKKICWGYVFIHLDLTLFGVNILPNWIGCVLILYAIRAIVCEEPQAALLRSFSVALALISGVLSVGALFSVDIDRYQLLSLFHALMWLFLQFQLLTHIAEMAKRRAYPKTGRILMLRGWLTVLYSIPSVVAFFFDGEWAAYVFAGLYLALVVWATFILNALRIYLWENEETLDRMEEREIAEPI
jgi:hypothetical protein